jgi:predicted GNAT family acetyltransferase
MQVALDSSHSDFLSHAGEALAAAGMVHSFLLGQTYKMNRPATVLARGSENGAFRVAALQTDPERVLILSRCSEAHAAAFAHALAAKIPALPGVIGPTPASDAFAAAWREIRGGQAKLIKELRLQSLTKLIPPRSCAGTHRLASSRDEELLFTWLRAFHAEAVPHDPRSSDDDLRANLRDGVAKEQFYLWEVDGRPVCLVGSRRETATERWIAPVYTPPAERGHGYASALTAVASERILADGKTGALFTDLENPTSNGIYQAIGYVPVADFRHFLFS